MRVLALQGSPRKKGNTDAVLTAVLDELKSKKAQVKKMHIASMNVSGCSECFTCQKSKKKPGCAVKDDMQKIYREMLKSDLVMFATPVFCWGMSAQLKASVDRCFAMCKFDEQMNYESLFEGKKTALVVTAGGPKEDGADAVVDWYKRFCKFMRTGKPNMLVCASVETPSKIAEDKRLISRAKQFARKLVTK